MADRIISEELYDEVGTLLRKLRWRERMTTGMVDPKAYATIAAFEALPEVERIGRFRWAGPSHDPDPEVVFITDPDPTEIVMGLTTGLPVYVEVPRG